MEAIEAEEARARVAKDETSIKAFFEKYAHADFDDPETRDTVLEYFVDKVFLYDDRIIVTGWYSDIQHEIGWDGFYEGVPDGEVGFEYGIDLSPGFDFFAAGGTT